MRTTLRKNGGPRDYSNGMDSSDDHGDMEKSRRPPKKNYDKDPFGMNLDISAQAAARARETKTYANL